MRIRRAFDPLLLLAVAGCGILLGWSLGEWRFSPGFALPLLFVLLSWAPGHLVSKALGVRRFGPVLEGPVDAALGLSVALIVATVAARTESSIDVVPFWVAVSGLVAASFATGRAVLACPPAPETTGEAALSERAAIGAQGWRATVPNMPLLLMALAGGGVVLWQAALSADDLPAGADMWAYLRFVNQFQTGDLSIHDPYAGGDDVVARMKYPGWLVVQGVLSRQGNLDPLAMYTRFLPYALIPLAFGTLFAMSRELFGGASRDPSTRRRATDAGLAVVAASALMYLTAVHLDWPGFLFMTRTGEDKVFLWFTVIPGVVVLALRFLVRPDDDRGGAADAGLRPGLGGLLAAAAGIAAVAVTHPLGVFQFGAFFGAFALAEVLYRRRWEYFLRAAALGVVVIVALLVPLSQRGEVSEDRLSVEQRIAAENPLDLRRLWVLSVEDERFMVSPRLLLHPFAIAGLLAVAPLAFCWRRSRAARFVVATSVVTALLVLTPVTAPLTARLISAGLLWRVLWLIPYPLAVITVFVEFGPALLRIVRLGGSRRAFYLAPAGVGLVATAALLPWIFDQVDSMVANKTFALPLVTDEEKVFFDRIVQVIEPGSAVMSPLGTEVADQTYRLAAIIPNLYGLAYRTRVLDPGPAPGQGSYAALVRFYNGPAVTRGKLENLQKYKVDYVIFLRSSEALEMTRNPRVAGLFNRAYGDPTYLVFRVNHDLLANLIAAGRF